MRTVTSVVYDYLDSLQGTRIISGWQLFDTIRGKTGKNTYPTTLLEYCRNYADISGSEFKCIDKKKSIYLFKKLNNGLGKYVS